MKHWILILFILVISTHPVTGDVPAEIPTHVTRIEPTNNLNQYITTIRSEDSDYQKILDLEDQEIKEIKDQHLIEVDEPQNNTINLNDSLTLTDPQSINWVLFNRTNTILNTTIPLQTSDDIVNHRYIYSPGQNVTILFIQYQKFVESVFYSEETEIRQNLTFYFYLDMDIWFNSDIGVLQLIETITDTAYAYNFRVNKTNYTMFSKLDIYLGDYFIDPRSQTFIQIDENLVETYNYENGSTMKFSVDFEGSGASNGFLPYQSTIFVIFIIPIIRSKMKNKTEPFP